MKPNRFAARRAAAQARRAAATPIILAADTGTEFKNLERQLAKHECAKCNGTFEVNIAALEAPFCVHCGHETTKPVQASATEANLVRHAAPEEADVTAVQCANKSCEALNIMGNETLSFYKTFHCVSCGIHLAPKLSSDDLNQPAGGEAEEPEVDPDAAGDENSGAGGFGGQPDDGGFQSTDKPAAGADPRQQPPEKKLTDDPFPDPKSQAAEGDKPKDPPAAPPVDPAADPDAPPADPAAAPPVDPAADPAAPTDDMLEVDMCDMVDGPADQPAAADMLMTEDYAYIKVGAHFVAQLSKDKAGDNKDIFGTDAFVQAVGTVLNKEGLKATMAAFGFEPIKVQVSVKAKVNQMVKAGVQSAKDALEAANKDRDAGFAQCLSLSILGHATGYFADVTNPLAERMVAALEELNVRGAKKLVAKVLAESAKDFSGSVVAKAVDLLASDVKYRNDIAANLDKLNPQATASQDDDVDALGDRLEAGARTVSLRKDVTAGADTGTKQVAALLTRQRRSLSPYGG